MTNQIEAYNSELIAKKEQLEKSRAEIQKLMREGHVTEQIQQKEKITKELVQNTDVDLMCEFISKPVLSATGNATGFCLLQIQFISCCLFVSRKEIFVHLHMHSN